MTVSSALTSLSLSLSPLPLVIVCLPSSVSFAIRVSWVVSSVMAAPSSITLVVDSPVESISGVEGVSSSSAFRCWSSVINGLVSVPNQNKMQSQRCY